MKRALVEVNAKKIENKIHLSNIDAKRDVDMPRICSSNIFNAMAGKLG